MKNTSLVFPLLAAAMALAAPCATAQLSLGGGSLLGGGGSLLGGGSLTSGNGAVLTGLPAFGAVSGLASNLLGGVGSLLGGTLNVAPLTLSSLSPSAGPLSLVRLDSVATATALETTSLLSRAGAWFPGADGSQFPYALDGAFLLNGASRSQSFGLYPLDLGGSYSSRLYGHDPYAGGLQAAPQPTLQAPLPTSPLPLSGGLLSR